MRYYFGYHLVNGICFPVKWVTDEGLPIGGDPKAIQVREITRHEYSHNSLKTNVSKYPYIEPVEWG